MVLPTESFHELMRRVQSGDPDAAAALVRSYEEDIRLEVRVRLRVQNGRVRRMFDSMDIVQSVLASFFAGVAAGRFAPDNPHQLLSLLVAMTRNKLLTQVRNQHRLRRDVRRVQPFEASAELHGPDESPSQVVAIRELLDEFRKRLSIEERLLSDRRASGDGWNAIATELGGTPDGRRKQLERAFARVAQELGLSEELAASPAP